MKTYIVNIETRKNDRDDVLGPFSSFKKAQQAILERKGDWVLNYDEYDSDFSKGKIYTEEESIEILERELE